MAREFRYKGKTLEELKKMDMDELARILPARQRRTIRRGFTESHKKLLKKIELALQGKIKKPIRTHCRDMIVLPKMVGLTLFIHNGKAFLPVLIEPESIGLYFGEMVLTRQKVAHSAPGIGATKSSSAISVK
jgi:small subunit ribosomal protein S19